MALPTGVTKVADYEQFKEPFKSIKKCREFCIAAAL